MGANQDAHRSESSENGVFSLLSLPLPQSLMD